LIYLGRPDFRHCYQNLPYKQEVAGSSPALPTRIQSLRTTASRIFLFSTAPDLATQSASERLGSAFV
jgi:hypothetical protein